MQMKANNRNRQRQKQEKKNKKTKHFFLVLPILFASNVRGRTGAGEMDKGRTRFLDGVTLFKDAPSGITKDEWETYFLFFFVFLQP